MTPCEPTLASCRAQQASCEAKVLCGPTIVSSSETKLALPELTTARGGDNLASRQVRYGSLHLSSGEAIPTYSGYKAKVSRIALNRAKAQARLSNEPKAKVQCDANPAQPCIIANIALLKVTLRHYTANFNSSSEAKAPCANSFAMGS